MNPELILEQAYKRNRRVRTIEDLFKIELEPSNRIIRPVCDNLIDPPKFEFNESKAWAIYSRIRALNAEKGPWYRPNYTRFVDRFRFWLHLQLIRFGVII